MINEFSVTPKAQNKRAPTLASLFFVLFIISMGVTFVVDKYRGVIGLLAISFLATAILMYTKYISILFHYDIVTVGVEEPLFEIRQTIGKREVTQCVVALADIVSVKKESRAERRAHKCEHGFLQYVYAPTLSPEFSYRLTVRNRYEKAEIIIEISDDFADYLRDIVKEAKELRDVNQDE